ncbi:M15 family metallopeptidase [Aquiflexum sp.]|uniref:M15 family metallopeptidase n=1 Tax=Aquiflexum sp. TaxID=1872584 RepID=UPI0035940B92
MEEIIKTAQELFKKDRHYTGSIDGIPGPMTMEGLAKYGDIPKSWPTNRRIIGFIQLKAKESGFNPGPLDGIWGPQTESAYDLLKYKLTNGEDQPLWRPDELIFDKPKKWPIQNSPEFHNLFGERGEHNLVSVDIPFRMHVCWEPYSLVTRIRCHRKVADSMSNVLTKVKEIYGEDEIKRLRLNLFGGCFNNRQMRQGNSWSMHAWGIALDFDPARNPLRAGRETSTFSRPEYEAWWRCWEEEGWVSLGRSFNFDWMHVQAARFF